MKLRTVRRIVILAIVAWLGTLYYNRFHAVSNLASDTSFSSGSRSSSAPTAGGIGEVGNKKSSYLFSKPRSSESLPSGAGKGVGEDALALMDAAAKGNEEAVKKYIVKARINARDSENRTALMYASWNGHNDICGLLLAAGADIDTKDVDDHSALDYAAGRGLVETVQYLLPYAKLNDDGRMLEYALLVRAVYADDIAQLPPGKKYTTINRISPENRSVLHIAVNNGSLPMTDELIRRGANVNLSNSSKQTALHWAAWGNQAEIVSLLIKKGASVSSQDSAGNTPLLLAIQNNSVASVQALLAGGARKDIPNRQGKMPIILAQEKGYQPIVDMLK